MERNAPTTNPDQATDSGFAGTLKNIQLNDLIQMCCLSAASLCMRVTKGDRQGTIFIVDGDIVHAACDTIVGEEAFYRILGWQTGSFESIEMATIPERTIDKNCQFLIMEAARRVDERQTEEPTPNDADDPDSLALDDRLRVLIVDDSPMMRKILASMLTTTSQIRVVGMAGNGREAIRMIDELSPDLVTLDVNMPVMDGSSTIKHIMIKRPCPVLIMSNPGDGSSKTIFNFLELGAVDFMCKPTKNQDILLQQKHIVERIQMAATANVANFRITRLPTPPVPAEGRAGGACHRLVVVFSGPGGHTEKMRLLAGLMPAMPRRHGAVVTFHELPPAFNTPFASYLSERCGFSSTTIDGQTPINGGWCYVGSMGMGLTVQTMGGRPSIEIGRMADTQSDMEGFLTSAAAVFGNQLAVVLLSGTNAYADGYAGLRAVRAAGGRVIIHSRASGMVPGPLDGVVEADLADAEVEPGDLVETIVRGFEQ
jgi:two-component system, chemotaxis family, protein-glutamate methylesterase/glutaminase